MTERTVMRFYFSKITLAAAALSIAACVPALAADVTGVARMTNYGIYGYAWDKDDFNNVITVEMQLFDSADSQTPVKTVTVKADSYNEELVSIVGDGWHWFESQISWSSLGGKPALVKVYGTDKNGNKTHITDIQNPDAPKTAAETKATDAPSGEVTLQTDGPGQSDAAVSSYKKGESLGMFETTGYCNCTRCSNGHGLTYSGTEPRANHTISADLTQYPIGTKLMIGDTVYTVEDMGSSVAGNKIDIYYASHQEALAHGTTMQEVFRVIEE